MAEPMQRSKAIDIHDRISEIEYEHVATSANYGIDVPTGWYPVIIDFHEQMEEIDEFYTILGCRQQNGGLRMSVDVEQERDKEKAALTKVLIRNAEDYCASTCQVCSSDQGELRALAGRNFVLCDVHWEERKTS